MAKRLDYPPRSARVFIRLRPDELDAAVKLAASERVLVPELMRRLLSRAAGQLQPNGHPQDAA